MVERRTDLKIFIGTMLTFLFVCSLIVCGFFAYKIYFPADAKNKSEVPNHMQENKHEKETRIILIIMVVKLMRILIIRRTV